MTDLSKLSQYDLEWIVDHYNNIDILYIAENDLDYYNKIHDALILFNNEVSRRSNIRTPLGK